VNLMAEKLELRLDESPVLRAPVLLAAFAGWGDGAVAGTGALQYLVGKYEARRLGEFESDDAYEYTSTRPTSRLKEDGTRELIWPSLALYACALPDSDRDVLILVGPEPNLRWRAQAEAVADVAERFGVSEVVVLGSYWDRVSHLGQALLTGRAADAATRERLAALGLPESTYQGPTGFPSALLDACGRRGLVSVGLSGRAPHYVQGITHPKLAHGLLQATERLVGLRLDVDALEQAGHEQERLLTERVQQEPKLWRYVQQLAAEAGQLSTLDDFASSTWQTITPPDGANRPDSPSNTPSTVSPTRSELPSGKDLVDAVEEFLRGDGQS
jgi:proteasome assembly chaperone (PAC2) family protein